MSRPCSDCRFWQRGGHVGECRRNAPADVSIRLHRFVSESDANKRPAETVMWAQWPVTEGGDWCGEWQERAA